MRRLKRSAQRAAAAAAASQGQQAVSTVFRFNASRRIPSWNCIARENSSGSLEEDALNDQLTVGIVAGPSSRSNRVSYRTLHDGSDSESESIDLNSWTRSGGPLMRTASAHKFVNFVHSLELDLECSRARPREDDAISTPVHANSRVTTPDRSSENTDSESRDSGNRAPASAAPASIMVSEGDLIQPERIENGIVFNVVRRDALNQIQRSSSDASEQQRSSSPEADVENLQMECCEDNASSASERDCV